MEEVYRVALTKLVDVSAETREEAITKALEIANSDDYDHTYERNNVHFVRTLKK